MISELCNKMPSMTLLDFAYLSTNVYHDPKDIAVIGRRPELIGYNPDRIREVIKTSPPKWLQIKFDNKPHSWSIFGFQADFYIKVIYGEVRHAVIAVRGTDNIQNGIEDLITWGDAGASQLLHLNDHVKTRLSDYFGLLQSFHAQVKSVLRDFANQGVLSSFFHGWITGHSLGGALANLMIARKLDLVTFPHAVTFNPPGIGAMQGVEKNSSIQRDVITVRAKYDFVSAVSDPYGLVLNISVPESEQQAEAVFDSYHRTEGAVKIAQTIFPPNMKREVAEGVDIYETLDVSSDKQIFDNFKHSVLKQHSMDNLCSAIMRSKRWASEFYALQNYIQIHDKISSSITN